MRQSLALDFTFEQADLLRLRSIIFRHVQHGVLSAKEGAALIEAEDARWVDEELTQAELKWLQEILRGEGILSGETP